MQLIKVQTHKWLGDSTVDVTPVVLQLCVKKFCDCSAYVVVCAGSNSHTQEEALFPLSNDNRACVAMATGCAFYGLCVCVCIFVFMCVPCSLFARVHCLLRAWCNTRFVTEVFLLSLLFWLLFLCNFKIFPTFLSFYFSFFVFILSTHPVLVSIFSCF